MSAKCVGEYVATAGILSSLPANEGMKSNRGLGLGAWESRSRFLFGSRRILSDGDGHTCAATSRDSLLRLTGHFFSFGIVDKAVFLCATKILVEERHRQIYIASLPAAHTRSAHLRLLGYTALTQG